MHSMMTALNTIASGTLTLSRLAQQPVSSVAAEENLQKEVDELYKTIGQLKAKKFDLKQQLDREKILVQHSQENLKELQDQCPNLIGETTKTAKELQWVTVLKNELYAGLQ